MATASQPYDALIVGGGHNGLVCASYLAAGGLRVCVVERRSVVGGAAVTEEFHPGFRNSTASYTVSLLNPKVIRDLSLLNETIPKNQPFFGVPYPGTFILDAKGVIVAKYFEDDYRQR